MQPTTMLQTPKSPLSDLNLTLDAVAHLSLRDHVRKRLRLAIISGSLRSGEKLNERLLARELGVSTTPLKEALRQLEGEGLIEVRARRGLYVRFNRQFAEEMILARAALESCLAALAAKRLGTQIRTRLEAVVEAMSRATDRGDIPKLIESNECFHGAIHEASGSTHIVHLVQQQRFFDESARMVANQYDAEPRAALREHIEISNAILSGDAAMASVKMTLHVKASGIRYLTNIFGDSSERSGFIK